MNKAKVYIKENKERFISELLDLLRIPSISAQSERKPDMLLPREECPRIQQIAKKKRYYLDENGKPVLCAENSSYTEKQRVIPPKELTIQGVALKVIKDIV